MKRKDNKEYEVISKEDIFKPTGEYQESGREVIYTRKKVVRYNKLTVTVKSNEPSEEALKATNKMLNRIVKSKLL